MAHHVAVYPGSIASLSDRGFAYSFGGGASILVVASGLFEDDCSDLYSDECHVDVAIAGLVKLPRCRINESIRALQ
jgi:hypothetical protein